MTKSKTFKKLQYLDNLNGSNTAVVLFHGYGASMEDLYGFSNYISGDFDWHFPNGPISVPLGFMMEGRAWFPIDTQELEQAARSGRPRLFKDKRSDEFDQSQREALEFLNDLRSRYENLVVGGFSQGAMLASHIFTQAKADALALFSGTLIDQKALEAKLEGSAPVRFLQTHGKGDPMLSFAQAKDLYEFLTAHKHVGDFIAFEGGHEIPEQALLKFAGFLKETKTR